MTKARKQSKATEAPAKDAPAMDGPYLLAYVGENEAVGVCGYDLAQGVPVVVTEAVAKRFKNHPNFEVSRGDIRTR